MKRIYLTLLTIVLVLSAHAQEGLLINAFFDKAYQHQGKVTEVLVKGKKLKPYKLTLFRSITLKDMPDEAIKMEKCVLKDTQRAVDKEEGRIDERLYYGFYCLKSDDKNEFKYLFYRNMAAKKGDNRTEATLVYMEGYTTLEELKQMFK